MTDSKFINIDNDQRDVDMTDIDINKKREQKHEEQHTADEEDENVSVENINFSKIVILLIPFVLLSKNSGFGKFPLRVSLIGWSEGGAQLRRTAYVLPVRAGARGVSQTGAAGYDADCVPPPGRIATGRRAHFSQKCDFL